MTDETSDRRDLDAPEAVVAKRSLPSIVWLVPVVAALVGGFVAWRTLSERGPEITIAFATADGLEAGKTLIKYKEVEIGVIEDVSLNPDLSGVVCRARMVKDAEDYLTEGTRFWVVTARVAGGQVSGLGTLLSGAYIGIDPVREGKRARAFQGLAVPPVVTTGQPGKELVLRSYHAGAMEVGTPIYFRKIRAGEVVASELDPSEEFVTTRIFVNAPYDDRVRSGTRFWKASGIDVSLGAEGVRVDTESIVSILIGGIAFETIGDGGAPAPPGSVFALYPSREETQREVYTQKAHYMLHFDQSVRGLKVGAPVEFRGIQIGQVRDMKLEWDRSANRFRIPVLIEIEPERIGNVDGEGSAARRAALDGLVKAGLRAQLKSGSLLTGQLLVDLDMHAEAEPAEIVWNDRYPEFPTVPTPLEEIANSVTQIAKRLERVPLDEIAVSLRASLDALHSTLGQAERTLASANGLVAAGSPVNTELRRALTELTDAARSLGLAADQIERQPNSLIFGKGGRN
jgi:paraquat-inducible protein B